MRVIIGGITRRRPKAFGRLLESFAEMKRPEGAEIIFVFCENDEAHCVCEQIEAFRERVAEPVHLLLEPRKGIPYARNRVLEEALALDGDFMTFADDDETVDANWLVKILAAVRERDLDLAGGPVWPVAPQGRLTAVQGAILEELQRRNRKEVDARNAKTEAGRDGKVHIYTNNWCLRLRAVRERRGLGFDNTTAESGGEDYAFSEAMRYSGARNGWVPEAWVEEVQSRQRLTLRYQYLRRRDQTRMNVVIRQKSAGKCIAGMVPRSIEIAALALALPVVAVVRPGNRARVLFSIVRKAALVAGLAGGIVGARSRHYAAEGESMHIEKAVRSN